MDVRIVHLVVLLLVVNCAVGLLPQMTHVHPKFEFKYSFKGPYLIDSQGNVPFWNYGGSAIPSDDSVRVCPSIKSRRGWVWTKNAFDHAHWMVDISLRVTGRLKNGADGMAIWYTDKPGTEGPVYGMSETWRGIGIFLDSFDNDGLHDNPKIQVVLNDGARVYEHHSDGIRQEAGSCLKEFRNRPYPFKMKITYLRGVLEVWIHEGLSLVEDEYELCVKVENIPELKWMPSQGHFGVSAATGGLSDDHDVMSFLTHSITPLEEKVKEPTYNEQEFQHTTDQYHKMSQDFDRRRDDYRKEHPDTQALPDIDWQKEVEMEQNMRLVADMQMTLQREIRAVAYKVDVLITGGSGGVDTRRPGDAVSNSIAAELSQIKTAESNILHQLADLRAAMDRRVPEGGKAATSEQLQPIYETKALVSQQTQQLEGIHTQMKELSQNRCPSQGATPSCLSPWLFVVVIVIQLLVMLCYSIYRQAQERNAKKFF